MKIQFNAGVNIGNYIFFSAKNFNGLFKLDKDSGIVQFVSAFPDDYSWTEYMHQCAIEDNGYIFFFPYCAKSITKYAYETNKLTSIALYEGSTDFAISNVIKYRDKYILIPRKLHHPLALFDSITGEVEYEEIKIEGIYSDELYCDNYSSIIHEDVLYIPIYNDDRLFTFNLLNGEKSIIQVIDSRNSAIAYYDDFFWIVSADGKEVLKLNTNFSMTNKYRIEGFSVRPFQCWMTFNKSLFLGGCLDDKIYKYDKENDEWINYDCIKLKKEKPQWAYMCGFQEYDDKLYIFPSANDAIFVMNSEGEDDVIPVLYDNNEFFNQILFEKNRHFFEEREDKLYFESEQLSLEDLLRHMKS